MREKYSNLSQLLQRDRTCVDGETFCFLLAELSLHQIFGLMNVTTSPSSHFLILINTLYWSPLSTERPNGVRWKNWNLARAYNETLSRFERHSLESLNFCRKCFAFFARLRSPMTFFYDSCIVQCSKRTILSDWNCDNYDLPLCLQRNNSNF